MKTIKIIWILIGMLAVIGVNLKITCDYFIDHKEPSSYFVYIALLLYMQMFLKHKDESE